MQEFVHPAADQHVEEQFHHFKRKHGVNYESEHEHEHRKNIFRQNLRFIHSHNRGRPQFKLAVNHLADKSDEELKARRGFKSSGVYNTGKPFPYNVQKLKDDLPDQYDWRIYGAVTPVKGKLK